MPRLTAPVSNARDARAIWHDVLDGHHKRLRAASCAPMRASKAHAALLSARVAMAQQQLQNELFATSSERVSSSLPSRPLERASGCSFCASSGTPPPLLFSRCLDRTTAALEAGKDRSHSQPALCLPRISSHLTQHQAQQQQRAISYGV